MSDSNGLHILFSLSVGAFITEAVIFGSPRLIFGAIVISFLALALRAQGRMQLAREIEHMANEYMKEEKGVDEEPKS